MAKDNDINLHVKALGVEQAKEKLDTVGRSTEEVGEKTEKAAARARDAQGKFAQGAEQAADATEKLNAEAGKQSTAMTKLGGTVTAMAAKYVSITAAIAAVTKAIHAQTQAMEENAAMAAKQQNALLRLQFLGDLFKERPELRQEVQAMAEFGRRPVEQVADAWYNLRSKSGGLDDATQMSILREALEMGRTDPDLPLDTLVDMFSLYAKQSGVSDANRIQNVLQQTITDAGGSSADVARYMPQFLPIGISGGLTPAQSSGLWAYATTQLADASIATTGLRATFMGLQGRGNPEGQKMLEGMGITPDMDFFTKIGKLSGAGLSLADAEQIAGREGAPVFLSLLNNPQAMMRTVGSVTGADRGDIDLTADKIKGLFGSDAVARNEEDLRLLQVSIDNIRASGDEMEFKRRQKIMENVHRQSGMPEALVQFTQRGTSFLRALGWDATQGWDDPEFLDTMSGVGWQNPGIGPTVINNQNVIYNQPDQPARPRSGPEDLN